MEISCGVVLVNFGTVLLLQYPQGHWDLPKGHVEDDEEYTETMKRELGEETGIEEITITEDLLPPPPESDTPNPPLDVESVFNEDLFGEDEEEA